MNTTPYIHGAAPAPAEDEFQNGPVAGIMDGQGPHAALFVAPVGIGVTRAAPALLGSSGTLTANGTGGTGQVFPLVSTDPQRRAIIIGAVSGTPRISHSRPIAESGGGLPVTGSVRLAYAGELYVYFPTATDAIGFFCEIDPA